MQARIKKFFAELFFKKATSPRRSAPPRSLRRRRGDAEVAFVHTGELGGVGIAAEEGDLAHRVGVFFEQAFGHAHAVVEEVLLLSQMDYQELLQVLLYRY